MARMRFFSLPLALKYLKICSQVPFAFNKILIFFNRGSSKEEVTQFLIQSRLQKQQFCIKMCNIYETMKTQFCIKIPILTKSHMKQQ